MALPASSPSKAVATNNSIRVNPLLSLPPPAKLPEELHILVINNSTAHAYNIDNNDLRGWILLLIGPFIPGTACALARPSFFHANIRRKVEVFGKVAYKQPNPPASASLSYFFGLCENDLLRTELSALKLKNERKRKGTD